MKKLEKWLKKFIIFLIRVILPGKSKNIRNNSWQNFNRILVFRLDTRLGNSILILSLVQSIKKSLPNVCVDVLMTSSYLELYQNHPAIEKIIPYDQKHLFRNPFRFLVLIFQLRRNEYDAVFSSNNPDAFSVSQAIFNRLVTQNHSVGFDWKESSRLYSDVVTGNTEVHYAKSQFDLWRHFDEKAEFSLPKLYMIDNHKSDPTHTILLWLGATGNKILDEDLVDSLIRNLEKFEIDIHLAVGPHDQSILDRYSKSWRHEIRIINLDIKGIAEYFKSFKCIIMPDTGPMHLVAALGIPLVQVFVNSNVSQYGYIGKNRFIIDKKLDPNLFNQFIKNQIISA